LPLLLYGDGVSVGWGSNVHLENRMISLGIFPPDLMRAMIGKLNIGFSASVSNRSVKYVALQAHLLKILRNKTHVETEVRMLKQFKDIVS
jgi:hypothetical protein